MSTSFEQTSEGRALGELLAHLVEDGLTADEALRLREGLHSSAARDYYLRYLDTHSALQEQWGTPMPFVLPRQQTLGKTPLRWFAPMRLAAAAVAVLTAGLALWFTSRSTDSSIAIEVLGGDAAPQFVVGQRLALQRLKLTSGMLQFRLDSGAVVEALGPAEIELLDPMHLRVLSGNVTTDVSDQAKGFVIETANARVVDLGTRFGVNVGGSGDTDVVVFEGKVEVFEPQKNGKASPQLASLTEGDALRVDSQLMARRLSAVPLRGDSQAMLNGEASLTSVVAGVSDNLDEEGFNRYYSIVPGGMGEGASVYSTTSKPRWQTMPGAVFPKELMGADVVGTFNEDRKEEERSVELELTTRCAVYVMLDTRGPVPAWLKRDFTDTGLRLRSGPWKELPVTRDVVPDADGYYYIPFSVWRREVPAGTVELGPPVARPQSRSRTMYGIAVKQLP